MMVCVKSKSYWKEITGTQWQLAFYTWLYVKVNVVSTVMCLALKTTWQTIGD